MINSFLFEKDKYFKSKITWKEINTTTETWLKKEILSIFKKKFIIKFIKESKTQTKIFYPSTIFLNNKKKYFRFKSYLTTKEMAEKALERQSSEADVSIVEPKKVTKKKNVKKEGN